MAASAAVFLSLLSPTPDPHTDSHTHPQTYTFVRRSAGLEPFGHSQVSRLVSSRQLLGSLLRCARVFGSYTSVSKQPRLPGLPACSQVRLLARGSDLCWNAFLSHRRDAWGRRAGRTNSLSSDSPEAGAVGASEPARSQDPPQGSLQTQACPHTDAGNPATR